MKPKVPLLIGLGLGIFGFVFLYSGYEPKPMLPDGASVPSSAKTRGLEREGKPANSQNSNAPTKKNTDPASPQQVRLTPDVARKLISDFAAKNSDLNSRARFSEGVIKDLCKNGYTNEAWGLIDSGNGIVRNFGLSSFFRNADLPPEDLLGKITNVPKFDMSTCFLGMLNRYPPDQLSKFLGSPEMNRFFSAVGDDRRFVHVNTAVANVLQRALDQVSREEHGATYQMAKDLDSKGLLEPHDFILIVQRYSNKNIFEQWEEIKTVNLAGWDSDVVNKQRQNMLSAMVTENAPLALKGILNSDGNQIGKDLTSALKSWTNIDSQGAADWYSSTQASLNGEQRELVSSSFAEIAISTFEFESARQWAEQIQDPEKRKTILENVEQKRIEHEQKSTSK